MEITAGISLVNSNASVAGWFELTELKMNRLKLLNDNTNFEGSNAFAVSRG